MTAPSGLGGNATTKRRSSNPAQAAMTGAGILASSAFPKIAGAIGSLGKVGSFAGGMPLAAFGVPLGGAALGALLHTLMTKPGFNYDSPSAGKFSSQKLRELGNLPQTLAEKQLALMKPSLDDEVGGSGETRRDLWTGKLLSPGGPLAHIVQSDQRQYLDPDIRKRLAGAVPEAATVDFREVGQGGNLFTDVMLDGRRISRTPGHRLPVDDVFGFRPRPTATRRHPGGGQ